MRKLSIFYCFRFHSNRFRFWRFQQKVSASGEALAFPDLLQILLFCLSAFLFEISFAIYKFIFNNIIFNKQEEFG
jgi:hypothetical protein